MASRPTNPPEADTEPVEVQINGQAYVIATTWADGSCLLVPIPDGMTAEDLGTKFEAPKVERVREGGITPEGKLAEVEDAFRALKPTRIDYPVSHPQGVTSTLWQCPARRGATTLTPEAIAQTLLQLADQGGATKCERIEMHETKRGSGTMFTVRGWRA